MGKHTKKRITTDETRKILSESRKRFFENGGIHPMKGKHHTNETKIKIGKKQLGKKKVRSPEGKISFREKTSGKNNYQWIEDRTKLSRISRQGERRSSAYLFWRKSVWLRDNWKCKIIDENCKGGIEAHHILCWKDYPELRYEISNGITLCHAHHPRTRVLEKQLIFIFQKLIK